ncbi:MAG: prepilin-type N-terminal cleavage/methylation domain-containing protein [Deferrisomatales bacterium]|nr:prepilin-type N-terminal cleavage/methylation domain-containing protein [Deferrisomatales bacterium]
MPWAHRRAAEPLETASRAARRAGVLPAVGKVSRRTHTENRWLVSVLGRAPPGARGFTLVEALVAVAVFSVGLVSLAPLVVANVRANDEAAVRTRAVCVAQDRAEDLRGMDYPAVRSLAAAPSPPANDGVYSVELAFPPVPAVEGDEDDLTRVRVTVRWEPARGGAREVSFVTTRARY